MRVTLVAVGLLAVVALVAVLVHRRRVRNRPGEDRALRSTLDERLAAALPPGRGSHLETAPTVRRLAVVERVDDGETSSPVYAPVVRVDLETVDAPGTEFALEYVADVLAAIHPTLRERDAGVRYYDVEFTFGPDGLLVSGECRRVTVPPEFADRLVDDDGYRAYDLRRDLKRGDATTGPPSLWEPCRDA
ncbi:hypothetical protein [Halopiger goleimassiliensis]|uniref:hypothetical protein n=1 Tax=Halopiger goleimassiliensis TaxID=1293048 RepID=UPI000677EFAB|nr:hypothetical protein [Halopiger goleimassiliensis]